MLTQRWDSPIIHLHIPFRPLDPVRVSVLTDENTKHQLTIVNMRKNGDVISHEQRHTGLTAVHLAAIGGHLSVLKILTNSEAYVNKTVEGSSWTALHFAAAEGHEAVVEWLLGRHCTFIAKGIDCIKSLELAVRGDHDPVVRALLKNLFEIYTFWVPYSTIVSLIQSDIGDRSEGVLGALIDCIGALGEEHLDKLMRGLRRDRCQKALRSLVSLLKERSRERVTDAQG